jgi:hypothetical protein
MTMELTRELWIRVSSPIVISRDVEYLVNILGTESMIPLGILVSEYDSDLAGRTIHELSDDQLLQRVDIVQQAVYWILRHDGWRVGIVLSRAGSSRACVTIGTYVPGRPWKLR